MDRDNYPVKGHTDVFLDDVKADVVGCEYKVEGSNSAWLFDNTFHMGMVRVRSQVMKNIKLPWFMFKYSEDGTQITHCECDLFKEKLIEQGARIIRRGRVEHTSSPSKNSWHYSA